jgi:hypothetical protein
MRGPRMSWGEVYQIEERLRAAIIELNKQGVSTVTMVEAIDEAAVWPQGLDSLDLKDWGFRLDSLIDRTPLLTCAVASENDTASRYCGSAVPHASSEGPTGVSGLPF